MESENLNLPPWCLTIGQDALLNKDSFPITCGDYIPRLLNELHRTRVALESIRTLKPGNAWQYELQAKLIAERALYPTPELKEGKGIAAKLRKGKQCE